MASVNAKAERGRTVQSRRSLVEVVTVKDTDRPIHVFSRASGELIAMLKADANVDLFLESLTPEAFE